MSDLEKLQKAVELTSSAGYNLRKEAFDFLSLLSATQDPSEIMKKVIQEIENSREKPLFIDKDFLERVMEEKKIVGEEMIESPEASCQILSEPMLKEGKKHFHPFAKDYDANLTVINNPEEKLGSDGTIDDYLEYFCDRFKRMEKILRQRIDVRSARSVTDALKASKNEKIKIIAMITNIRESKDRILLTIEDFHSNATVLVPNHGSQELIQKARSLLLDQVICINVRKTRGALLIADEIIFPDVATKKKNTAPIPVHAVLTSDLHVGSSKFQEEAFERFILWLNGKCGNEKTRKMAGHVKYVLLAGDVVDGIGVYPNQLKELAIDQIAEQYRFAGKFIEQIPDYIEVVIIPGNHDASRNALPQPAILKEFMEPLQESRTVHSLGNPCYLSLDGVEVLLYHGRSLDDIISTVPGMVHDHPEKAMRLLMKSRHLAPVYGGKTPLASENNDLLVIDNIPDIFHSGHIHKLEYGNYRGVTIVNSGCWQEQTNYMKRHGFVPTPGKVPVVNLQDLSLQVVTFI
ncbi:MAG: DNA-directed DNA polymerase II small subunit [Candidatus Bathyarchaeota archaeon]|jgi:DNA polymerase II small subunit